MRTLECGPHDLGIAGTIKRVVDAPRRHGSSNVFLNRNAFGQILGIDTVRGAEFPGHGKFGRINVNANNGRGPGHFGALNHGQANRAQAKDGHRLFGGHLTRIQDGTQSGRDTTPKQTHLLQGRVIGNLGATDFRQDRAVFREMNKNRMSKRPKRTETLSFGILCTTQTHRNAIYIRTIPTWWNIP